MSNVTVDFRPVINAVERVQRDVSRVSDRVEGVETQVGSVSRDLHAAHAELSELRHAFLSYVQQAERTAAVQRAETKIGNLKAELDRQYGHYAVVRRTSVGVLQAFDVGNVTNEVVAQISEELMIQSPRYWLAPALVALAAWSRDDKEIAERSLQEAYSRNQAKTSLFFTLVLRRVGRNDGAVQWLRHYLSACNPTALSREFSVILEASAQGAFGPAAANLLAAQLEKWNSELRMRQEVMDAQIDQWFEEIKANRQELVDNDFQTLARFSPQFGQIKMIVEAATGLGRTTKKFTSVRDDSFSATGLMADQLDDLLEQLVSEYDDEELPLRREVAYSEAVIESNGDLGQAQIRADQFIRALEECSDAISLQTKAAINPDLLGVSVRTQRVAIGSGHNDFRRAVTEYTKAYRTKYIGAVDIELGRNHSEFAGAFGFPGFTSSTAEDESVAISRLNKCWHSAFEKFIAAATFQPSVMAMPIIGLVVGILFGFLLDPVIGIMVLVIGGGIVLYLYGKKQSNAEDAVREAERQRTRAIELSRNLLIDARAQFLDLMIEYEELDKDEEALLRLIDTWPTNSHTGADN